ncbi:DMT family transporter [Microvirga flavescens]|uniref:DMT family transporter n=1 Tax=Microvirga flavescens TaxID=2249811 RepID=UPI000DDAFF53|nr:DMT family transporter [Microvirga flavescens]
MPPANPPSKDNPLRGIALLLVALIFFSCSDAASKGMTATIPAVQAVWLRFVIFTVLMFSAAAILGKGNPLRSKRPLLQIVRGFGVLGSSTFFVMGLRYLPMAEATAISFISPIFVTGLSIVLLNETVGIRRWAAVFVGLIGVLIVIRPGTGAFDLSAFFPVLSALSWAVALTVTRKVSAADDPIVPLTYAAVTGLVVLSFIVPFYWAPLGWHEISLALITGITSTVGQFLVVLSFQHAKASVLAPFSYMQLVSSSVLGFFFFGSVPDFWTVVGAGVIVASGLYTAHRERIRGVS